MEMYNKPQIEVIDIEGDVIMNNTSNVPVDPNPGPSDAKEISDSGFGDFW